MREEVISGSRNGTFITVSRIALEMSEGDDGADLACRAAHPAVAPGSAIIDTAKLSVLCK